MTGSRLQRRRPEVEVGAKGRRAVAGGWDSRARGLS